MGNVSCCMRSSLDAAPLLGGETRTSVGLGQYLSGARALLEQISAGGGLSEGQRLTVVTGNEASDADSIFSALGLAYSRVSAGATAPIVPVMSIPRAEFKLRPECVSLAQRLGVAVEDIVFADEVDLPALRARDVLDLVLVDHNELCADRADLGPCVRQILDHHVDQDCYSWVQPPVDRRVAFDGPAGRMLVASACTLVAEEALQAGSVDQDLATLLMGVILLDSINLLPAAGKVTPRDEAAVAALSEHADMEQQELFDWLQAAKFDPEVWAQLTVADCLRYDFKKFEAGPGVQVGFSAMLLPLSQLLAKDPAGTQGALEAWSRAKGLRALLVMTMTMDAEGAPTRETLVYSADDAARAAVAEALASAPTLEAAPLELKLRNPRWATFSGGAKASRKQVAPAVVEFLRAHPLPSSAQSG